MEFNEEAIRLMEEAIDGIINPPIKENSETLLIKKETSRFSSAIWYEKIQEKTIILAGLGGIGSYVAFLLSRMNPNKLFLYDPDIIEAVNMSGQLYSKNDIGKNKANAMYSMINNYSNYYGAVAISDPFTHNSPSGEIMICGFDNMAARKLYFEKWKEFINSKSEDEKKKCLFIDGRLAAESLQVFCLKGDDSYNIDLYEKNYLFNDVEADEDVCSYKQTTFMANMIGSLIVNLFVNFVANECEPLIDRDLPFKTFYDADTMYFRTQN